MVDDITKYLVDWAYHYFKSRDAFHKKIKNIRKGEDNLVITFEDKIENVIITSFLTEAGNLDKNKHICIITLNNRKNLDTLVNNWDDYAKFTTLKVYFINPFSTIDFKWIIHPHTHNRVCDKANLRAGIVAMFETVDPLPFEIMLSKIKE